MVTRDSPRGSAVLWRGGDGSVWRWYWTCLISQVRQMVIFVGPLKIILVSTYVDSMASLAWFRSLPKAPLAAGNEWGRSILVIPYVADNGRRGQQPQRVPAHR